MPLIDALLNEAVGAAGAFHIAFDTAAFDVGAELPLHASAINDLPALTAATLNDA